MRQKAPKTTAAPTVADVLLHYLKLEGVTHVFGIPGGGLANLLTAFKNARKDFQYVICRQETGAAFMADGYHRATGRLGVVMVTSGPGATNAITGVMNAQNDGSAVLALTGEINQQFFGMGYLQEGVDANLDTNAIYEACTGYSVVIADSSDLETLVKQALRDARNLPHNAVHISMPNNVTVESLPQVTLPKSVTSYRAIPAGIPMNQVKDAIKALTKAKRPLIFLGNGCREVLRANGGALRKKLAEWVEYYGIPIMTTADGKGIFPESHPLSLRVYGIASCLWPYYWLNPPEGEDKYDGLLVIGSSLGELSTIKWSPMLVPDGPFIQVDINQAIIARSFEITHGIVGEAGAFIEAMYQLMPEFKPSKKAVTKRKAAVKAIKKTYSPFNSPKQYDSKAGPMQPAAMIRVLQKTLPHDTKIFIDAGNCVGWSVHYLSVNPPMEIFTSLSMGPMGFAVGAVVGAKAGCPDTTCVGLVGDGAFMMNGAEISTAKQNNLGAIWIVLYDNDLSMVSQGQAHFFPDKKDPDIWEQLYEIGEPDLEKYAEGLGADAYTVKKPADLEGLMPKVIKRANQKKKPQVVIVEINRKSVPPYYTPPYIKKK